MSHNKSSSVVALALLFTLVAASKPTVAALRGDLFLAQSTTPTPFPLPDTVAADTTVRIDGSNSMATVNQSLKQQFEGQYAGTSVEDTYNGTGAALQALQAGEIDLAAIGRPLTAEEKAEGLTEVPVGRSKIAIIVGEDNPFTGNLTFEQFAQIFRGEITDWSQVGGEPGPIRLIDHPEDSDTRQAFRNYPVFQSAPFEAGATAVTLTEDSADAIVNELGNDGISYITANQVVDRPGVRIIPMHQTLPTDPRYPYSHPLVYVYRGEASPAVASFLGFATAPVGQAAVAAGAGAIAPSAIPSPDVAPEAASPGATTSPNADASAPDTVSPAAEADPGTIATTERRASPWLWLLPLLLGIPLLLWLLGKRRGAAPAEELPPAVPPAAGESAAPTLADRAGTVISADRTSIADTRPPAPVLPEVSPELAAEAPPAVPITPVVGAALAGGAALTEGAALAASTKRRPSNRIVLAPRTTNHAYAYWEAPAENREELKRQGGNRYRLRVYDVTGYGATAQSVAGLDLEQHPPHSIQELICEEADQDRFVPNLQSDRDYIAEIGYFTDSSQWLSLARSAPIRMPVENPLPDETVSTAATVPLAAASAAVAGAAWLNAVPAASRPNQITLFRRGSQQAYAQWEIPAENKAAARQQGGRQYTLRICDVTGVDLAQQAPSNTQQYACQDSESHRLVSLPQPDRDYVAEIGYLTGDEQWILLARSTPVRIPAEPATDLTPAVDLTQADGQQEAVEATKFNLGQSDLRGEDLADVDANLPALADGYGDGQIFLLPRDPNWAYTYWDVPNAQKEALRREGGSRLALRFYDVTGINLDEQRPHSLQQYDCDELARDWYLPIPVSDRDYVVEIGYPTNDGRWLLLARSNPARIPPIYPSNWLDDQFVTVDWQEDLHGATKLELPQPGSPAYGNPIYDRIFNLVKSAEAQRVAGSLFGSMQQVPEQALSSFSVSGLSTLTASGLGMSGVGMTGMSGAGITSMSGIGTAGMSGVGVAGMSGIGVSGAGAAGGLTASGIGMSGVGMGIAGMSGIGMSGVGITGISAMSGVGMSGVGMSGVGMSGIGMSGVGMSGVGMMSGIGITGMSGVGMISGAGMMSGIGMSGVGMSGIGMSGIGITGMSGIGMSGMGLLGMLTMSGIGASGAGMYSVPTMSGVGMSGIGMSGAGYTMSGVGMSGIGMYSVPTMSGVGMSGVGIYNIPTMSGIGMSGVGMGYTMSGVGMSGVGMGLTMSGVGMSGIGFGASIPPIRPRKFWLVANAELIVHGATEPDATVMVGDREIKLSPDGTFRFQVAFPDGDINYPILAVAADGEQTRSIRMDFNRETPVRNGNTKDEAVEEWFQQ